MASVSHFLGLKVSPFFQLLLSQVAALSKVFDLPVSLGTPSDRLKLIFSLRVTASRFQLTVLFLRAIILWLLAYRLLSRQAQ